MATTTPGPKFIDLHFGSYPTTFDNAPLVQRVPGVGHEPTTFLRPEFFDEIATAGLRYVDRYCPTSPDHLRGPAALVAEARRMGTLRLRSGPRDHRQTVTEPAYRDKVDAWNRERLGIEPLPERGSVEALVAASKVMVDDRWAMSAATGYQLGESELGLRSEMQSRDEPGFIETSESTERLVSSMRAALDEMGLKPGVELIPEARGLVSELQAHDAQLYYAEQSDLGVELPGVDSPAPLWWSDELRRTAASPGPYVYDDFNPTERNRAAFGAVGEELRDEAGGVLSGRLAVSKAAEQLRDEMRFAGLPMGTAVAALVARLDDAQEASFDGNDELGALDEAAIEFLETEDFVDMCRLVISEQTRNGSDLSPRGVEMLAAIQMCDAKWHAQHGDRTLSVEAPDVAPSVDDVVTARQQRFPELRQEAAGIDPAAESEGISLG